MPGQRANTVPRDHAAPAAKRAQPRATTSRGTRRAPGALASTGSEDRSNHAAAAATDRARVSGPGVREVMHARLKAMAEPRASDNPELARLRRLMRDPEVAAELTANVDRWPAPTEEQREVLAALLQRRRPGR